MLVPELPPLPEPYVARARLHRLLDAAVDDAQVVTIVAPAAAGKSTLLLGWSAADSRHTIAYLALDALDNDPAWFWSRVMTALRGFDTGIGAMAADYLATDEDRKRFISILEAELASLPEMVLILDQLEQVASPDVVDVLGHLLVDLPSSPRVVLASRVEPPFRNGLLRARGMLATIPAGELAFDTDEIDAYVQHLGGPGLSRDDVDALRERTEGWVGGVRLAVSSASSHQQDPRALVRSFAGSSRYVADLLLKEVLEAQTPEVQTFLLTSSVLDTFDAALCDAVRSRSNSASIIDWLERSGMFVERVDADGPRLRYQRLFREFLHHQLRVFDPEGERSAHRGAARWYERQDDIDQAIHHLLASGDDVAAIELVLAHGERCAASGRLRMVRGWLKALPSQALLDNLELMMSVGRLCVMTGLRDEATMWLERARWRLTGKQAPLLEGLMAMLMGHARLQVGHPEGAIDECQRALAILERLDQPAPWVVDWVHHLLGTAHTCMDDFEAARRHRDLTSEAEEHTLVRAAYSGWLNYRQGRLDRALEYAEVTRRADAPWLWSLALVARGAVRRERNQIPEAEADLVTALELGETWSRPFTVSMSATELARMRLGQGRPGDAHQMLTKARSVVEGPVIRRRLDVTEAVLWLVAGDVERSLWVRRRLPSGHDTAALDVRLALAQGRPGQALSRVAELGATAQAQQERIMAQMLEARAHVTVNEHRAMACLRRAVDLGRQERFVRIYAFDLPDVQHLMRRLAAEQEDPYVFGLLAAIADAPSPTRLSAVLVDALSARESIVLRYLPTSLSNKEVATELHMSVNTLKTHLKHINRKLGTGSRVEAVAAARSLDLL
ncbi:MAG: LuxR C-terminal-related transcriptional regulator [Acidimicrobiales bacterium]